MAKTAAIPAGLKQKMAASVSGTSPSLIPPKIVITNQTGVTTTEEDLIQDEIRPIEELIADPDDCETLRLLVLERIDVSTQAKELEKKLDVFNAKIKKIVGQYGINSALCDGNKIAYFPQSRSSINRMKLLGAGVDEDVIIRCTDTTQSMTLKITPAR